MKSFYPLFSNTFYGFKVLSLAMECTINDWKCEAIGWLLKWSCYKLTRMMLVITNLSASFSWNNEGKCYTCLYSVLSTLYECIRFDAWFKHARHPFTTQEISSLQVNDKYRVKICLRAFSYDKGTYDDIIRYSILVLHHVFVYMMYRIVFILSLPFHIILSLLA